MESIEAKVSAAKRARATGQESGRERRVQHREEELFPIRHDNPSAERLDHEAEANKKSPRLGTDQVDERREQDGQAFALAHLSGSLF